jgi:hypothetical protein
MIVRESILFKRGIEPKKILDIGHKRRENLKNLIKVDLKNFIEPYFRGLKISLNFQESMKNEFPWRKYKSPIWELPGFTLYASSVGDSEIPLPKGPELKEISTEIKKWIKENTYYKVVSVDSGFPYFRFFLAEQ